MDAIHRSFNEIFADWEIELPTPLPARGSIYEGGWTINFVTNEVDGEPCLDFLAEHRMTNMQHTRILSSGEVIGLETFMESVGFDPDLDADEEAARRRYQEHNAHVGQVLREKGLM